MRDVVPRRPEKGDTVQVIELLSRLTATSQRQHDCMGGAGSLVYPIGEVYLVCKKFCLRHGEGDDGRLVRG